MKKDVTFGRYRSAPSTTTSSPAKTAFSMSVLGGLGAATSGPGFPLVVAVMAEVRMSAKVKKFSILLCFCLGAFAYCRAVNHPGDRESE